MGLKSFFLLHKSLTPVPWMKPTKLVRAEKAVEQAFLFCIIAMTPPIHSPPPFPHVCLAFLKPGLGCRTTWGPCEPRAHSVIFLSCKLPLVYQGRRLPARRRQRSVGKQREGWESPSPGQSTPPLWFWKAPWKRVVVSPWSYGLERI